MKKIAGWIVDGRVFIFIVTIILTAASVYGMSQVNINYDMSKYLPDDSAVRADGAGVRRDGGCHCDV